jgi:hypothetical protein
MNKKLFISHAKKDKEIVIEIITLLKSIGVKDKQIFCSSVEGYGIIPGRDSLNDLKEELSSMNLVLFILTHNFYKSSFCLSEMGASWILAKEIIPIVVPPFTFNDIKGVLPKTQQGVVINEKMNLNSLRERIIEIFNIQQQHMSLWENERDRIVKEINKKIRKQNKILSDKELSVFDSDDRKLLELVKNKGIIGIIDNKNNNYTPVTNRLKDAKKSLKIIAYFGEEVSNGLKSTLFEMLTNKKLRKPFEIKLLTSRNDPKSSTKENVKLIDEVQKLENSPMNSIKHIGVKKHLEELKTKIKKENLKIEVRYYNTQVRYAVTIIDDKWAWWTPYHPGYITEQCISFELVDKRKGSIFNLCNQHFEKLWAIAEKDKKND